MSPRGSFGGQVDLLVHSASGSFEVSPPRIHRFSFENDFDDDSFPSTLSSHISQSYGVLYDTPHPRQTDADSDRSSKGPPTPPLNIHLTPPRGALSPNLMHPKSTPRRVSQASSTFFFDSHSLSPGQSLLCDDPSFIGLKDLDDVYPHATPPRTTPPRPPSRLQSTSSNPRPSLDSTHSASSNRGITCTRLALDLPLARSRSSSLSALIKALEDASPGWYQSLMDGTIPEGGLDSPLSTSQNTSPQTSPSSSLPDSPVHKHDIASASREGLPPDMLTHLAEMEELALQIKRMPTPRRRTLRPDIAQSLRFVPANGSTAGSYLTLPLASPPSSLEEDHLREATARPISAHSSPRDPGLTDGASATSLSPPRSPSRSPVSPTPHSAANNIAQHPKLTKTLGLNSVSSGGVRPAAKLSITRVDGSSAAPSASLAHPYRLPSHLAPAAPSKRASSNPPAPPKSLKFPSLFRRRPSMPVVPLQDPVPMPSGNTTTTHSRKSTRRPITLAAPVEHLASGKSGKLKNGRHSNVGMVPAMSSRRHGPPQDQGSFLQM